MTLPRSKGVLSLRSKLLLHGPGSAELRSGFSRLTFNGILRGSRTLRGNQLFYSIEAWRELAIDSLGSQYFNSPPNNTVTKKKAKKKTKTKAMTATATLKEPSTITVKESKTTKETPKPRRKRPTGVVRKNALEEPTPEMLLRSRITIDGQFVISRRNISIDPRHIPAEGSKIFARERKLILDGDTKSALLKFCFAERGGQPGEVLTRFSYPSATPVEERIERVQFEKLLDKPQKISSRQRKVLFLLTSMDGALNGVALVTLQTPNSISVPPAGKPRRVTSEAWERRKIELRRNTFAELLCVASDNIETNTQNLLEGIRQILVEQGYTTIFSNISDVFENDFERILEFEHAGAQRNKRPGVVRMSRSLTSTPIVWPAVTV